MPTMSNWNFRQNAIREQNDSVPLHFYLKKYCSIRLPISDALDQVCGLLDILAGRAASFEACALRSTWASYS